MVLERLTSFLVSWLLVAQVLQFLTFVYVKTMLVLMGGGGRFVTIFGAALLLFVPALGYL